MRRLAAYLLFALAVSSAAQTTDAGRICGTILDENGQPAARVSVVAFYLGAHSGVLPAVRTDDTGHYCLIHVPFGKNIPVVDDPHLGYPNILTDIYGTKAFDRQRDNIADLSEEQPSATIDFRIPYKAASVTVHLTDAITGAPKQIMIYRATAQSDPNRHKSGSQKTTDVLLLPPNENVLLTVRAPGYREWPYDNSSGYVLNLLPGEHKSIDVQLQPK